MPIKSMEQGMHEFKAGKMHSGKGGPVVSDRKQAIAISLSSTGKSKKDKKPRMNALSKIMAKMGG